MIVVKYNIQFWVFLSLFNVVSANLLIISNLLVKIRDIAAM